ncbi:MAG: sirohydrochlorin cobaltochelatase [Lachnospiraceae bacterium]
MQGILVVSFGTSFDETREKNITAIEKMIESKGHKVYRAFTSNMIRRILAKRGILIDDTKEALLRMKQDGFTQVKVLPTHLLYGEEYEKLQGLVAEVMDEFESVQICKPLLANEEDGRRVLRAIYTDTQKDADTALILMGHGTEHFYNAIYPALNFIATEIGYDDLYVCTVEGYPTFEDAVAWIQRKGFKKAVLAPLMLVAGDHAVNDMASDEEDSLRTLLEGIFVSVSSNIKGLAEYPDVKELYLEHLEA